MATTYANALKLITAKSNADASRLGYVNTILRGASITQQIPIVEPNQVLTHKRFEKKPKTSSLLQTRTINQNPDPTQVNQYEEKVESTFQIGDAIEVDYVTMDVYPEVVAEQINDKLIDLGFNLDYRVINGDPQGNDNVDVRGLKDRLTTDGVNLFNSTDLAIGASAANFRTFIEYLRKAYRQISNPPGNTVVGFTSEMIVDGAIAGRLQTGAQAFTAGSSKYADLLDNRDVFDVEGVPLLITREDDADNAVIATNEGASNDTSSIYMLSLGLGVDDESTQPNGVIGLSNNIVQMTPEVDGNIRRVTLDYRYGISAPYRSAARIRQLKAS